MLGVALAASAGVIVVMVRVRIGGGATPRGRFDRAWADLQ